MAGRHAVRGLRSRHAAEPNPYSQYQDYGHSHFHDAMFWGDSLSNIGFTGADRLMWSGDYPHGASTWPRSREFIDETFSGLPEESRRKIVHDTAARLYGLDV